jgi:transposase
MARAYSVDLRERVLAACDDGLSRAEAAARFRVGERTVYRWRAAARHEGRRHARPHAGGRRPVVAGTEDVVRDLATAAVTRDATLAEQAALYQARTGRTLSPSALCRAFRRLGLTRKKRRSAPTSGSARMSGRSGRPSPRGGPASTPTAWCSSTRPASPPT